MLLIFAVVTTAAYAFTRKQVPLSVRSVWDMALLVAWFVTLVTLLG